MLALKSSYSIMEAKWKEQPSNPPPKASWLAFFFFFVAMAFFLFTNMAA